jgi:acetylornithine deacetylase/succinyl-diaminopimelate desuccinylase-like protein
LNLSKGTNSVPDICKVRLDVRPATTNLKEKTVRNIFNKELEKTGCSLIYSDVIQDLGCLSVEKERIKETIKAVKNTTGKIEFINPNDMGYGDGQMIFEEMKIPTLYFGAGPTSMCHKADEYVNISDLKKLDSFLDKLYLLFQ